MMLLIAITAILALGAMAGWYARAWWDNEPARPPLIAHEPLPAGRGLNVRSTTSVDPGDVPPPMGPTNAHAVEAAQRRVQPPKITPPTG